MQIPTAYAAFMREITYRGHGRCHIEKSQLPQTRTFASYFKKLKENEEKTKQESNVSGQQESGYLYPTDNGGSNGSARGADVSGSGINIEKK